jgi:hypothetical protein
LLEPLALIDDGVSLDRAGTSAWLEMRAVFAP